MSPNGGPSASALLPSDQLFFSLSHPALSINLLLGTRNFVGLHWNLLAMDED